MTDYAKLLLGKDIRSIAKSNDVAESIHDQVSFDALFSLLWHHERLLVMRVADAIDKITLVHREFLIPHKSQLLSLLNSAVNKELKWHLAQLVSRLPLNEEELKVVWSVLSYWVQNPNESKIVRVNSLQGLHDLGIRFPMLKEKYEEIVRRLAHEPIPSLQARIKKLGKS
jgi:hypothetical protein